MFIVAWKDCLVIRNLEGEIPEELTPYLRYNEKLNAHLIKLSIQNLYRLSKYYPKLTNYYTQSSKEAIESLKYNWVKYNELVKTIGELKKGPCMDLSFKVPPLGEYQIVGCQYLIHNPMAPLFADCGVGKTYLVIISTEKQYNMGIVPRGTTIVFAKLATLETGWMADIEKFSDMKASLVWTGSSYKRKEKLLKALEEPADIYVTNHDTARVLKRELADKNFKKVVVDESTILKGYRAMPTGGAIGKAICEIAHSATHRVIMSGTPAPNGPEDLWGQFKFLDPHGFILEPSYGDFKCTYMLEREFGIRNTFKTVYFNREKIPEIKEKVDAIAYQVKIRDVLKDLPERTILTRKVKMSKEQQAHYNDMYLGLSTDINSEFIAVDVKLAQIMKLRQITGGFIIDTMEKPHPIETAPKLNILDDLMEEIGIGTESDTKVIIYAQYRWEIETLTDRYKEHGAVSVYGDNTATINLKHIKMFKDNPKTKVIVLHPKSAAHGITLTESHYMIFYSISYSEEDNYQCIKRVERASQKHPMFIYYLLADHMDPPDKKHTKTIDEIIFEVLKRKERQQAELIDQTAIEEALLQAFTI